MPQRALVLLAVLAAATHAQLPNDACSGAIQLTDGSYIINPAGATISAPTPPPSCGVTPQYDLWFSYTNPVPGAILATIGVCGGWNGLNDSVIRVYGGSCGALLDLACDDDGCGSTMSYVGLMMAPNQSVLIQIGNHPGMQLSTYYLGISHQSAFVGSVGASCPAPLGGPTLSASSPILGSVAYVVLFNAGPNATGAVYVGSPAAPPLTISGCQVYLDLASIQLLLQFVANANGFSSTPVQVPNIPALEGVHVWMQAVVPSTVSPNGFKLTQALDCQLGI